MTTADPRALNYRRSFRNNGTEKVMCFLPTEVTTVGKVPVIYSHGAGFNPNDVEWFPTFYTGVGAGLADDLGAIAAMGHPVFVPALANQNWGNPAAYGSAAWDASRMKTCLEWAATTFGTRTDKVGILADSMGGLSLNWAWRNPTRVAAMMLRCPVIHLDDVHDSSGFASSIEAAYGGLAPYNAALPARDPVQNHANIAPLSNRSFVIFATDDFIIKRNLVIDFLTATDFSSVEVPGDHDAPLLVDSMLVANYFAHTIPQFD